MSDLPAFAAKLTAITAHEPKPLRILAHQIACNITIITSDKYCGDDKEAARVQLGKNLTRLERARGLQT